MATENMKTVLITGAGGAAVPDMIKRIKSAGYRVLTADVDPLAAGFRFADKSFIIPLGLAKDFFGSLLAVCAKEQVAAIIPLVDEELLKAADLEEHGILVLLPKKEFIYACLDKYALMENLSQAGIPSLKTRLASEWRGDMDFPLIVKPRTGRGSRGVEVVYTEKRLNAILKGTADLNKLIIQEYVDGPEFTISVVVWRDGDVQAIVPKEIISKKGITRAAVTRRNAKIDSLCREVQKKLRADGPFNVQLRLDTVKDHPFIFEINPRFSTSISLTIAAGVDELCGLLSQSLNGRESYRFKEWQEGTVLLRRTLDEFIDERDFIASCARIEKAVPSAKNESSDINPVLQIERHPFFVGPVKKGEGVGLPTSLPFNLGVHPNYAIPQLIITDEIRRALEKAYAMGSMASTPLGESPLSTARMDEVLEKLLSLLGGNVKGSKLLELGSGSGALLNAFKKKGALVTGLEIGPQGKASGDRYGIRIIDKPFKKDVFDEKFDCIYSYGFLEHIIELDDIFEASRTCLNDKGLFFHVVPNSGNYFDAANLGHLSHEHVNYFTSSTGIKLFSSQGFRPAKSALSSAGNELMLWGYRDSASTPHWPVELVPLVEEELKAYAEQLTNKTDRILHSLRKMIAAGQTIGFYAGGFEFGIHLDVQGVRYFDGDSSKHGTSWLKGLPLIEPPTALRTFPVDNLIICSDHYYDAIVKHLADIGIGKQTRIYSIETLGRDQA